METEDEHWDARAPENVYITQPPEEKELVGTGELKTEDEHWEARAPEHVYVTQPPEIELAELYHSPEFVKSLLHGKFI